MQPERVTDPFKVSSPRIYLFRMLIFLVLGGLLAVILHRQIWAAFLANPGLNGLIIGVLVIGILLSFRQVLRLFPEVNWVNGFRLADPGLAAARPPTLLAPMAVLLGDRMGSMALSTAAMRGILDSIASRLDEARDTSRYMTGLLVFLGLLGTFWGLIETVGSVGKVIEGLKVGGDAAAMFDALKDGLAAPLGGMGISFSSSLFGLAGSLILGFLDLQTSQAQNRFYTELEDWLATAVRDLGGEDKPSQAAAAMAMGDEVRGALDRLRDAVAETGSHRATTNAMANLAEAIQGLVKHMRAEQQMLRDWVEAQAEQQRDVQRALEALARPPTERLSPAPASAERPAPASAERPSPAPAERLAPKPAERSALKAAERPANRTAERPAAPAGDKPADRLPEKQADGSAERLMQREADRPAERPPARTAEKSEKSEKSEKAAARQPARHAEKT